MFEIRHTVAHFSQQTINKYTMFRVLSKLQIVHFFSQQISVDK